MKKILAKLNACEEATAWTKDRSIESAWQECERGDWMLWLAAKVCDRKIVVRAACAVARTALQYVTQRESRPRIAIETAEKWCDGNATNDEVNAAYAAAYAAANAANVAAYAAANANAANAKIESQKQSADIVRGMISVEMIVAACLKLEA